MGLVHVCKPEGLVWHEVQSENAIKIVQLKNMIEKCNSEV